MFEDIYDQYETESIDTTEEKSIPKERIIDALKWNLREKEKFIKELMEKIDELEREIISHKRI